MHIYLPKEDPAGKRAATFKIEYEALHQKEKQNVKHFSMTAFTVCYCSEYEEFKESQLSRICDTFLTLPFLQKVLIGLDPISIFKHSKPQRGSHLLCLPTGGLLNVVIVCVCVCERD